MHWSPIIELVSRQVDTTRSIALPEQEEVIILPVGDIQLDPVIRGRPRSCDVKRLERTIRWGVEHRAYFIGTGDYVDVASPSNRAALKATRLYDNVLDTLEEAANVTLDELENILAPTRSRWLGVLSGHHLWDFEDGTNTDTRLAQFLHAPHLGTSTFVTLQFKRKGKKKAPSFRIWAHHGQSGGKLLASGVNQLEHVLKAFDAEVYLLGHHHKVTAAKYPLLTTIGGEKGGTPDLIHRDRILATTGSFLKGYLQGSRRGGIAMGGYPEVGMMNPVSLGSIAIMARPRYTNDGYALVDLDFMSL